MATTWPHTSRLIFACHSQVISFTRRKRPRSPVLGYRTIFNSHIDFSKGNHSMKNATLCLLILSAAISTAFGADNMRMDTAGTLAISDKNGDDRIDREEYHRRMTEVFFFIDTDKDGNLSITEIQQVGAVDPRRFEAADRDGSHSLSLHEYLNALYRDFDAADGDSDGTLDMEELHIMIGK